MDHPLEGKGTIRRLYYIRHHSQRQIARARHQSRKTVKKAIMNTGVPQHHLIRAKPFVMTFPPQRQKAFFEGHRQAFDWYGGVPKLR